MPKGITPPTNQKIKKSQFFWKGRSKKNRKVIVGKTAWTVWLLRVCHEHRMERKVRERLRLERVKSICNCYILCLSFSLSLFEVETQWSEREQTVTVEGKVWHQCCCLMPTRKTPRQIDDSGAFGNTVKHHHAQDLICGLHPPGTWQCARYKQGYLPNWKNTARTTLWSLDSLFWHGIVHFLLQYSPERLGVEVQIPNSPPVYCQFRAIIIRWLLSKRGPDTRTKNATRTIIGCWSPD